MLMPSLRHCSMAGMPSRRAGDLDHDVGAVQRAEQGAGGIDGGLRFVGQLRRDLQGDEAVAAFRAVVDGAEDVGRHLDVLHHQRLVDVVHVLALGDELADGGVVVDAGGDGLIEDTWGWR